MIPEFLENKLKAQYSEAIVSDILAGYSMKRKVTLRINTLKSDTNTIKSKLKNNGIDFEEVPWSNEALIILNADENAIEDLDIYKNGEIYLQSLSSMLPPVVLDPKEKTDILDMAAAPGGKTTQICALTNNNANITACELNSIRAEKLKYNIQKQGATKVFVMVTDARKIDNFFSFDQILLDAPCSGSGTLSFDSDNSHFTDKLVQKSIKAQTALLKKAINILKSGHEMVYSTCSILQEENEFVVNEILNNSKCEIVPINFSGMENLPLLPSSINGTLCVKPNELYEGFFIAKIKKK